MRETIIFFIFAAIALTILKLFGDWQELPWLVIFGLGFWPVVLTILIGGLPLLNDTLRG